MENGRARRAWRKFDVITDRIIGIAAILGGVIIIIQTVGVAGNSLSYYFFGRWIEGTESFTEFGILYVTFLSAAWVLKYDGHVIVDTVIERLSPRIKTSLNFVMSFVCMGITLVFIFSGIQVTWQYWISKISDTVKIQGFPLWPVLLIIPIGSLLLFVQFVKKTYSIGKDLFKPRVNLEDRNGRLKVKES